MGITQVGAIKAMPYVFSNALSLLTCFPLAVAVIAAAGYLSVLYRNRLLAWIESISYEIYLIHAFTLTLLGNIVNMFLFAVVTVVLGFGLHWIIR